MILTLLALIVVRGCFVLIVVGEVKTDAGEIVYSIPRMASLMAIDTRPLPGLTHGNCHVPLHRCTHGRLRPSQTTAWPRGPGRVPPSGQRPCRSTWPKAVPLFLGIHLGSWLNKAYAESSSSFPEVGCSVLPSLQVNAAIADWTTARST